MDEDDRIKALVHKKRRVVEAHEGMQDGWQCKLSCGHFVYVDSALAPKDAYCETCFAECGFFPKREVVAAALARKRKERRQNMDEYEYDRNHGLLAGVWQHYKGGLYQVLGVAAHSETDERLVIYVSLTGADMPGPRIRARPLRMWREMVEVPSREPLSVGESEVWVPRFRYVGLETKEK